MEKISGSHPHHQLLSVKCQRVQEGARWWRPALLSWPELILSACNVFPLPTSVWSTERRESGLKLLVLSLNTGATCHTVRYSEWETYQNILIILSKRKKDPTNVFWHSGPAWQIIPQWCVSQHHFSLMLFSCNWWSGSSYGSNLSDGVERISPDQCSFGACAHRMFEWKWVRFRFLIAIKARWLQEIWQIHMELQDVTKKRK